MTNKTFYDQARSIFRYTENSPDRANDPWYFDCLNDFLGFASFCLNDNSLYPYWSHGIECITIIELPMEIESYSTMLCERRFLEEIYIFYIQNREIVWEYIDSLDWNKKSIIISVFLKEEEKQLLITSRCSFAQEPEKCIVRINKYMNELSNCNSYNKYVVSKYKIG